MTAAIRPTFACRRKNAMCRWWHLFPPQSGYTHSRVHLTRIRGGLLAPEPKRNEALQDRVRKTIEPPIPPDAEEGVRRALKQWSNIIGDHIRNETGQPPAYAGRTHSNSALPYRETRYVRRNVGRAKSKTLHPQSVQIVHTLRTSTATIRQQLPPI